MASIFDPNPKKGLTGLETLLGNVVMPQQMSVAPTNKQMIDAAILRGSLELLKPKQPNENFASQASRALEAAGQPAKTLADYRAAQATANRSGALGQSAIITNIKDDIEKGINQVGTITGVQDISKEYPIFYNNLVTNAIEKYTSTGDYASANAYSTKIFNELYTNIEVKDGKLSFKDLDIASPEMIDLISKANKAKTSSGVSGKKQTPVKQKELE
tara:strand:+ start:3539 stop:4186 length:648 start_codon:yes stop_codon:yes gene_type:complete